MKEVTRLTAIGAATVAGGVVLVIIGASLRPWVSTLPITLTLAGLLIVIGAVKVMTVRFEEFREQWEAALRDLLTSAFMRMTQSNAIPFGDRRKILEEFEEVDRRLSLRAKSGVINEDALTTDLLVYLGEATGSERESVHLVGAKYTQRREAQIGADLALVLVVRSSEGVHSRWCIAQAKRFDSKTGGYPEIDRKKAHTDKQIELMERYHPVSHYLFFNPPELELDGRQAVFGTRLMSASLVRYFRDSSDEALPAEIVLWNGVPFPEFFVNFSAYSLSGAPPKEVQDSVARVLTLAIDLQGGGWAIDLSPYFQEAAEFILVPSYQHALRYEKLPLRAGLIPWRRKAELAQAERERAIAAVRSAYATEEKFDPRKVPVG